MLMTEKQAALVELDMVYPYKDNIDALFDWARQWKIRVVTAGTLKDTAVVRIPIEQYKLLWGHEPEEGIDGVPEGLEWLIDGVHVLEIE